MNTFGLRRWTISSTKHDYISSRISKPSLRTHPRPQLDEISHKSSSNEHVELIPTIPYVLLSRLASIILSEDNNLVNVRIFVDYFSNLLRSEYPDLRHSISYAIFELEEIVSIKGDRYYCQWNQMLDLVEEFTHIQFNRQPLYIEDKSSNETSLTAFQRLEEVKYHDIISQTTNFLQDSIQKSFLRAKEAENEFIDSLARIQPSNRLTNAADDHVGTIFDRIDGKINNGYAMDETKSWASDSDDNEEIVEELIKSRKIPLTQEENSQIDNILNGPRNDQIITDKFDFQMTRAKIQCLRPHVWLNDEIINFHMQLLQERDSKLCDIYNTRKKSHFFTSFFMEKLLISNNGYAYSNVKRWSKKFDVFALEKVFIPINISNAHWALGVIFIQKKEIHYYDSMSGSGENYLKAMVQWLVDEGREKKNITIDSSQYKKISCHRDLPQQKNGVDCGVFTTICADFLLDNLPLTESSYNQREMPYYRRKLVADICRGALQYPMKTIFDSKVTKTIK